MKKVMQQFTKSSLNTEMMLLDVKKYINVKNNLSTSK